MNSRAMVPPRLPLYASAGLAVISVLVACSAKGGADGDGGAPSSAGAKGLGGAAALGGAFAVTSGGASGGSQSGGAPGSGGAPASPSSGGAGQSSDGGQPNPAGGNLGTGGAHGGRTSGLGSGGKSSASGGANSASGGSDIVTPSGYKLVWHDEFDVDGAPNPANWKFEKGFVRNEEDQWYQPDNASVEAGLLVIEGRKQRVQNPNYSGSGDWKTSRQYAEYTSSSLNTSGLSSFQYGRFEMRARIPTSAGMWPAWWTLGVSGEWPSNGEIDIMEFYNGKLLANVACGTATRWEAKWDSETKSLSALGSGWSAQFHVWRMDWDDQSIVLYLDDQPLNTTALSSMLNANGASPFKQKAYMLVNLAIGGKNGGDPTSTSFPQRYEVDYIRVFQKT